MSQELSFAPDRRSIRTTLYHFGEPDRRGSSDQESLIWSLDKIYQSRFNISQQLRHTLVNLLASEVPMVHFNLPILAAANFIVYHMRSNAINLYNFNPNSYENTCQSNVECRPSDPMAIRCAQIENAQMDPHDREKFDRYFNFVEPFIMPDVTGKTNEDISIIRGNYKITLLRYIIYVQQNTTNFMTGTTQNI